MALVAVRKSGIEHYPTRAPFHPGVAFPELAKAGIQETDASNDVYSAVRDTLALLGLDARNLGTPEWNPLGAYVRPGDKVVIKPNFVLHEFGPQEDAGCLTTHGSVLRAVLDYTYLAAGPEGEVVIADAPLQGADFGSIVKRSGILAIQEFYWERLQRKIGVVDLRQVRAVIDEGSSLIRRVEQLPGDPLGYCELDLGEASCLRGVDADRARYVVGDYDIAATNRRHTSARHSYVVSRTVLDANSVICVPKLKTHSKAGVTVCLKNMVGIIGTKDCLPHHRHGKANRGGDEFPADYPTTWLWSARGYTLLQGQVPTVVWRTLRKLAGLTIGAGTPANGKRHDSRFFFSGGWHGNDTIWRTVDDLNRILFFGDPVKRTVEGQRRRRYFALVDGIVGMEGNGPLRGTPRPAGIVMAGDDPLAIDVAASTLMGFDWQRIRMLRGIAETERAEKYSGFTGNEDEIQILSNEEGWDSIEALRQRSLSFEPASGWRNFVETQHVG